MCRRERLGNLTKKCPACLFIRTGSCQESGYLSGYNFNAKSTTLPPNVTGSKVILRDVPIMSLIFHVSVCALHFAAAPTTSRPVCAVCYLLCARCLNALQTISIGSSFTFLCIPQRLIFHCSRFPNFTTTPDSSPVHIQMPSHPYKLSPQFASLN